MRRSKWWLNRWARPAGAEEASRTQRHRSAAGPGTQLYPWDNAGPANSPGRATCVAVDPRTWQRVYLGTAAGGLWLSEDGGRTWNPQSDQLRSLSIGAVALDPRNPDVCYLATGEANLSGESYPGWGVYRRARPDEPWRMIGSPEGEVPLPHRIGAIAVDPFNAGHVIIGAATLADDEVAGLLHGYGNEDGPGFSWRAISGFRFQDGFHSEEGSDDPSGPYQCHSIVFHPERPGWVYAAVNLRGWRTGLYRSQDAGVTWSLLETGLPAGDKTGRASLAIGRSGERWVLWAYIAHTRGHVLGVFRSDDEGETWQSTGGNHFAREQSGEYSNCIAVCPDRAGWVICGGRDLHRTMDGGLTWQQVTEHEAPEGDPHHAPAEHHALAALVDGSQLVIYDAHDSGFSLSTDFGGAWLSRTLGLTTAMVSKVEAAGRDGNVLVAALQRGGVVMRRRGEWLHRRELRVDAAWVQFDPDDSSTIWATASGGDVYRHTREKGWQRVTPTGFTPEECDGARRPVLVIDLDPERLSPRPVLLGTNRIWRSPDGGLTWRAVSENLDGSPISAIHFSNDRSRRVFAGTEFGGFFCSTDGGNSWQENVAGVDLPNRCISGIATRPSDAGHVLVTIGPAAPPVAARVALSTDGGYTWSNADPAGALPDVPHNCLVFDSQNRAYAGNDYGVYRGTWRDGIQNYSWADISSFLPQAFVTDLTFHAESNLLTVATHGRGIFRHRIGTEESPEEFLRTFHADQNRTRGL